MNKRAHKAYKSVFVSSYTHLGAVQGRALIFTPLYTCTSAYMHVNAQMVSAIALPSLPTAPKLTYIPVCAQTVLHSLSLPGVSVTVLQVRSGETKENHISLCLPKWGHPIAAPQGVRGKRQSPSATIKKTPNTKSKPTAPTCSKIFTHPKFSILDISLEVNFLF